MITAPTLAPALKNPVPSAHSRLGNPSATTLTAAGKFAASANPKAKRTVPKPRVERAKPMGQGGQTPKHHGEGISDTDADHVDGTSHRKNSQRVCCLTCRDNVPVLRFRQADLTLQGRSQNGQNMLVHVIRGRSVEQESAYHPPVTSHGINRHRPGGGHRRPFRAMVISGILGHYFFQRLAGLLTSRGGV